VVTKAGQPVEFFLPPGPFGDTTAFDQFDFDLPPEAWIIGDNAYNAYLIEDAMADCNLFFLPLRKDNSKRSHLGWLRYLLSTCRKAVETVGGQIERLPPKHIHAVTSDGFKLKTMIFVLASSIFAMFGQQVATWVITKLIYCCSATSYSRLGATPCLPHQCQKLIAVLPISITLASIRLQNIPPTAGVYCVLAMHRALPARRILKGIYYNQQGL
jgi:hypothetical protein